MFKSINLVIIGGEGVGKKSLIKLLKSKDVTNGEDQHICYLNSSNCTVTQLSITNINIDQYDDDKYDKYIKFVVYDVTSVESFKDSLILYNSIKDKTKLIIIGNKCDKHIEDEKFIIDKILKDRSIKHFICSIKELKNIEKIMSILTC